MTRKELILKAQAAMRGELPPEQKVYLFYQDQAGRWHSDNRNPAGIPDDNSDLIIRVRYPETISDINDRVQGIWIEPEHRPKHDNRVY